MEGEVDGTYVLTVPFGNNQLGMTPYVNVTSSFARHMTLLEAELTKEMVGPFANGDAGTDTIRTRESMFVPYELVADLIGKDYTAGEAFRLC
jgi:hypothetical protein